MRTQFKLLTVMLLIVLLSVAGCTSSASQPVVTPEAAEVPTEMPTAPSTSYQGRLFPSQLLTRLRPLS